MSKRKSSRPKFSTRPSLSRAFVALLLLCGCESKEEKATPKATQAAETKVEPRVEPNPRISFIEMEDPPRTDVLPSRPLLEVEHATGGGVLRVDGECLFLESGAEKVGLVFKNPSARFDRAASQLVVSGVRVRVGETMFVRALRWGSSFLGFVLKPPLADKCEQKHYWLVDTVGLGLPTSADLNCDGKLDSGRAP
jgi:hypothetical protein